MLTAMAELHPQLANDCFHIATLPLSRLLLLNDCRFPWFLLVPDRDNICDITQLDDNDQQQLFRESIVLNRAMQHAFVPDRMNIACIGNMVPQLHVHHIARYTHDACWPAPVWGKGSAVHYTDKDRIDKVTRIQHAMAASAEITISWIPETR